MHQHDNVDYLQARMDDPRFAESMKNAIESLERYRDYGCEPGDSVRAILENDLNKAVRRCDTHSILLIGPKMLWIIRNLKPEAYGSPEKVDAWMEKGC